ncbi:hypothetical protein [Streptomyces sp. LUP30]|uniref:hypothetical protein n=1 Tax=Streptomyces sp. LUP30 TaxID=1890285 RepID=UPI0008515BB6|nr:hypothetical protein [Streptomyces sp. LUP30]
MSKVLTTESTVTCGHTRAPQPPPPPPALPPPLGPGLVTLRSTQKLHVEGVSVLVTADVVGATITGCPNVESPQKPCTVVTSATGESVKLRTGGAPVLLDRLTITADGTVPVPLGLEPTAGQSKLTSV